MCFIFYLIEIQCEIKHKNFFSKKYSKKFCRLKYCFYFCNVKKTETNYLRSLAQLAEQLTLNQWVQGSTPWRPTTF